MPGTGNHKGCPYDGFVGAYFQRNDRVWLRCVRNHHGLMKATYGDENGLVPGTGNPRVAPTTGLAGPIFIAMTMALWRPYKEMKMAVAAPVLTCPTATAGDGFLPSQE